ncbi:MULTISPECIES: hypothetical protein [unclassified Curtobacterium]|uniref:hypothetical protein n=1 Tax=unclassified Curtobacterium TaxID=257496 RepID=UPI0038037BE9
MSFPPVPPCPWFAAHDSRPDEAAALRRRARAGELVRIAHGRYADAAAWAVLRAEERHRLLARAVIDRIPTGHHVSHLSAAALTGVPFLGRWPERVHLTSTGQDRRTTNATFVVHADFDPVSDGRLRFHVDGLVMTDPTRTAIDLAMTLPFRDAVVALDHLLRIGADRDAVSAGLDRRSTRGRRRARRSLAFADPMSDSAGESVARVRLDEYGTPTPVLQHRFTESGMPDIVVDFWFPEHGVVIEFDGEAKYRDPAMRGGRSAEQVALDEKYREDRLRAMPGVRTVVRLRWADLWDELAFRAKLRRAALPMAR